MRKRIRLGDVLAVPLGNGMHGYSRVLRNASYAFYAFDGSENLEVDDIVKLPVIFFAAVRDSAVKEGRWLILGHVPLDGQLVPPPKFIQDPLKPHSFSIYENDGTISKATRSQCEELERAAVWEPEQIEDRLRDHFAGRENKWVKLMQIR